MFLSKKDTPKQFLGMYYAGLLNLAVCYFNLYMYNINGGMWLTLVSVILSLGVVITIFTLIKRKTTEILWNKLTKSADADNDDTTAPSIKVI